MPTCKECSSTKPINESVFPTVKSLVYHLQLVHFVNATRQYICGEPKCSARFDKLDSFKHHLRYTHNFKSKTPRPQVTSNNESAFTANESVDCPMLEDVETEIVEETDVISVHDFQSSVSAQSESFVARLYNNPSLPRNHVQLVINETDLFLGSGFLNILKEKCLQTLRSCGAQLSEVQDIQTMFEVLENPFKDLKTEHLRKKRFVQSGHFVEPKPYELGKEVVTKSGKSKWVKVCGQFIPPRAVLKKFFELPGCLKDTLNYMDSPKLESDTISNFIQGDLWRCKIERFGNNETRLPLWFFFDDFECDSDIGSHSCKIGGVYYTIPCIPPECRAKLENIFVALLFESEDRVEFKNEEVLKPLLAELSFLQKTGIEVDVCGEKKRLFFVFSIMLGDNLGLHQLLDFAGSFSANFFCRFCSVEKSVARKMVELDLSLLRNVDNYNSDVAKNDLSKTGLTKDCVFNQIESYHVTSNYAVDPMHDISEGILKYVLVFLLKQCIKLGCFTLQSLNLRLRTIDYGPHVTNKPPVISRDSLQNGTLKMSASEATLFLRHLGVILGDLMCKWSPAARNLWSIYICLMRLVEVIFAKTVPKSVSQTFPILVKEFLSVWMEFGNEILPKFHFLLHYATVFQQSGPVSHQSVIRHEAKHREFKRYAKSSMSRVNLPHSLAIKHQFMMCSRFIANKGILPETEVGPMEEVVLSEDDHYFEFFSSLPDVFRVKESVFVPNWVNYKGTRYSPLMVLVVDRDESTGWPIFGKVQFILLDDANTPIFVCIRLKTMGFSDPRFAYQVCSSSEWLCVKFDDLVDPMPVFNVKDFAGNFYVVLRYLV